MKKQLLIALLFEFGITQAQVQVDFVNMSIGDVIFISNDTTTAYSILESGENLSWNFSNLESNTIDSIRIIDPTLTNQAENFTDASLAFGSETLSSYTILNSEGIINIGFGGVVDSIDLESHIRFTIPDTLVKFPLNYGNTRISQSWGKSEPTTVNISGIGQQTIKVSHSTKRTSNCDAWGTMQIPIGTYDVLRVQEETITIDSIFGIIYGFPIYLNQYSRFDTTYTYSFYTNNSEINFRLAEITYEPAGNKIISTKWLTNPEQSLNSINLVTNTIIYPNPTNGNYVKIDSPYNIESVSIFDTKGKLLLQSYNSHINISKLPSGIYFTKIQSQNKNTIKKLIIR